MARIRQQFRRSRIIVLSLALSVLVIGTAAFAVLATNDDDVDDTDATETPYAAFASAQLFEFPGNWDESDIATVQTIYPFQTSWQRMLRDAHPGSESLAAGTSCAACHGNAIEEQSSAAGFEGPPTDHYDSGGCIACHGGIERDAASLGESLATRDMGPGVKDGDISVKTQAAFDDEFIYLRFEWESDQPGVHQDLLRFDGEEWQRWGDSIPDVLETDERPTSEDRLALMMPDGDISSYDGTAGSFGVAGCYIGCHDDQRQMPDAAPEDEVVAHDYFGEDGIDVDDMRKYLFNTRDEIGESGAWDSVIPEDEIEELFHDGDFLDMWMWRAGRGGPAGYADDLFVLDYRHSDEGSSTWSTQSQPPEYMYDPDVTGYAAIHEDEFEDLLNESPMIMGENVVEYDPDYDFQEGDIIPRRVLDDPEGSRGDILANSWWEDGRWILEMRRSLDTGNPDDVPLVPGNVYSIGVAIFDDHVGGRRHHVSFPVTIGMGVEADIVAVPLNEQE